MNIAKGKLWLLITVIVGQVSAIRRGVGPRASNYGSSFLNQEFRNTFSKTFESRISNRYGEGSSYSSNGIGGTTVDRRFRINEAPRPYNFDYHSADEQGNSHYHSEEADERGTVRGSYGYTDFQGLYRFVDYVADANGFRATIRTNEPGTNGKESPADVQMTVEKTPLLRFNGLTSPNRGNNNKLRVYHDQVGGEVEETFTSGLSPDTGGVIIRHGNSQGDEQKSANGGY